MSRQIYNLEWIKEEDFPRPSVSLWFKGRSSMQEVKAICQRKGVLCNGDYSLPVTVHVEGYFHAEPDSYGVNVRLTGELQNRLVGFQEALTKGNKVILDLTD